MMDTAIARPHRPRRPADLVAAGIALLVVAGLIGLAVRSGGLGTSEAPGETAATGATGGAGVQADRVAVDEQALPGVASGPDAAGGQVPDVSQVIRTAEMSLEIPRDSFDERYGRAVDVAEANGGFVADSRSRDRSGTLTLRVPADRFDDALRALRRLGTVEVESVHGQDVTAEYVDLGARLRISQARLEVLLDLLQEATTIPQTIRVQNALDETQLVIEQIQGRLRLLDDQTSLATIRLDLREEGADPDPETPSIPNAFERAVAGFVGVIAAIVIGLGYLLPLIVLGLVGWFVTRLIRRRRVG